MVASHGIESKERLGRRKRLSQEIFDHPAGASQAVLGLDSLTLLRLRLENAFDYIGEQRKWFKLHDLKRFRLLPDQFRKSSLRQSDLPASCILNATDRVHDFLGELRRSVGLDE